MNDKASFSHSIIVTVAGNKNLTAHCHSGCHSGLVRTPCTWIFQPVVGADVWRKVSQHQYTKVFLTVQACSAHPVPSTRQCGPVKGILLWYVRKKCTYFRASLSNDLVQHLEVKGQPLHTDLLLPMTKEVLKSARVATPSVFHT